MSEPQPTGIVARLVAAIGNLRAKMLLFPGHARSSYIAIPAWLWLDGIAHRISQLAKHMQAGTLRPLRRHQPSAPAAPRAAPAFPRVRAPAMPRRVGWFNREMPDLQPLVAEIHALLTHPEWQPLLAAQPLRFGRLLRPLCRALGLSAPTPPHPAPLHPAPLAAAQPQPASRIPRPKPPPPHAAPAPDPAPGAFSLVPENA